MVNLLGNGFIGRRYAEMYRCVVNERNDLTPKLEHILYMISTTDNYNIHVNPHIDIDTNLTTLIRTLENCKHKNTTFNFISSWFVYGDSPLPCREDSPCNPSGFYSITKRAAEQLLIEYCEVHKINYRILRLANVIGPGDYRASPKKNVLTYVANQLKAGLDVQLYDNGDFYRDYIHVDDVCRAIHLVVEQGEYNTIYNIGNNDAIKFKDAVNYIANQIKSKSIITNVPADILDMSLDYRKLFSLGYKPIHTIDTMLNSLI
jgi:nucleoside-diphosphate-sugar epimerase